MTDESGASLKNAPWQEVWTCPSCYRDHHDRVTACDGCGIPLACTIEHEPVAVCTIVDAAEAEAA